MFAATDTLSLLGMWSKPTTRSGLDSTVIFPSPQRGAMEGDCAGKGQTAEATEAEGYKDPDWN